jgi:hypothetical protein
MGRTAFRAVLETSAALAGRLFSRFAGTTLDYSPNKKPYRAKNDGEAPVNEGPRLRRLDESRLLKLSIRKSIERRSAD